MAEIENDPEKGKSGGSSTPTTKTNYKTEQPVMASRTGVDIRKLLSSASGKDFEDMTSKDLEDFAASKGVVRQDVRKLSRAFDSVKKNSARQYLIDQDGFNVIEENLPLTRSGRDKGNKRGLDIGDLVGAGNNLSLLAGFASRELTNYRKAKEETDLKSLTYPTPETQANTTPSNQVPQTGPVSASNLLRRPTGTTKATAKPPSLSSAGGNSLLTQKPTVGYPGMWGGQGIAATSATTSKVTQSKSNSSPGFTGAIGDFLGDAGRSFDQQVLQAFREAPKAKINTKGIKSIWGGIADSFQDQVLDAFTGNSPAQKKSVAKTLPTKPTQRTKLVPKAPVSNVPIRAELTNKKSIADGTDPTNDIATQVKNVLNDWLYTFDDNEIKGKRKADSLKSVNRGVPYTKENGDSYEKNLRRSQK